MLSDHCDFKECVELPYGLSKAQQSPEDGRSEKDQHRDGNYIDSITQGEQYRRGKGVKHQRCTHLRDGQGGRGRQRTTSLLLDEVGEAEETRKDSTQNKSELSRRKCYQCQTVPEMKERI